ncbi:hypothetical protein B0H03_10398 [Rathayibacter iranicus NCPPB 2253 = VKM Ac-1602]|uniref:Secreted protein n=1 Tax=Rathayibacter iranicus NCPPB 2253 = VKM Ac-1602 TaxID=1328868 RepID=A0ABX5LEU8_9MICO|nr:hypothetical protein B0H03_10398 [Rathayibacter iranicus NCPPB 2253 = VKM Ac-1602]
MAVLAVSLGLIFPGATAAEAATGPGGNVITCTVSLDNPHPSGHVNGTISAQGLVTCTGTVAEIYIKTSIRKVSNSTVASQTFDSFNVSRGSSVGAKPCSDGPATFRSQADVLVHFPAGYTPTPQTANRYSPHTAVACGNATRLTETTSAADGVSDGTTTWTIVGIKN